MDMLYDYSNILDIYAKDIFDSLLTLKLPTTASRLFFSKTHKKNILNKIDESMNKLTEIQKEELITEFLKFSPKKESITEYNILFGKIEKTEFKKFNEIFSYIDKQYENLKSEDKIEVIKESLTHINSLIVKIRESQSQYALEAEDITPFFITEQILDININIIKHIKTLLKKKNKKPNQIKYLLGLIFISFLNLESIRRKQKTIDCLYEMLAIITTTLDKELDLNEKIEDDIYEIFSLG